MKKSLLVAAAAIGALMCGGAAMAQDEGSLSFNAAVTTNYIWRGFSQTDNAGAVQVGADYAKGLYYVGAWASNVDFGTDTSTELDLYAGIKPSVGDAAFDFGVIAYTYPNQGDNEDLNVVELKAGVSYPMGAGSVYAAAYIDAETLEDPYVEIGASYPLTDKLAISGAIGDNVAFDYTTWNAGATYAITDALAVDLRYSEVSKSSKSPISKPTLFATLKAAF